MNKKLKYVIMSLSILSLTGCSTKEVNNTRGIMNSAASAINDVTNGIVEIKKDIKLINRRLDDIDLITMATPEPSIEPEKQPTTIADTDITDAYIVKPSMSQSEINQILSTEKKVRFDDGIYNVDAVTGLKPSSDQEIILSDNAVIKAISNSAENYNIFKLDKINNTTIIGGSIVGERSEHDGTNGEWGMGIYLFDCSNITIKDIKISDCWGDGIYLGASESGNNKDVLIKNVELDNNRRQGISVISAINLLIEDTIIKNTNGTAPAAGIDFEPNRPTQKLDEIRVNNLYAYNNEGAGIQVWMKNSNIQHADISINGFKYDGGTRAASSSGVEKRGLSIYFSHAPITGHITVSTATYRNTSVPKFVNAKVPSGFKLQI